MSLEAMNWVLRELPKQIEPSSFKVLIYMADCVDSDGKGFYKSHDTLAEETGLSKSTIKTHLRKLVDAGYIRRGDQRLAWHLHHRPTVYELCLPSNNRSSRESDSDPQPTADASGTSRIERDGRGSGGGQQGVSLSDPNTNKPLKHINPPNPPRGERKEMVETRKAASVRSTLPDGWMPNDRHAEFARRFAVDLTAVLAFFKSTHSCGATSRNWDASFMRELRGAARAAPRHGEPLRIVDHSHTYACRHVLALLSRDAALGDGIEYRTATLLNDGLTEHETMAQLREEGLIGAGMEETT